MNILLSKIKQEQKEKGELLLLKEREKLINENINSIETIYRENRRIYHDLKNSNVLLMSLISEKKYDLVINELKSNIKYLEDNNTYIFTKNQALNSICNVKLSLLKSIGAEVKYEITTNSDIVKSADLCVIIGNAFDNIYEYYINNTESEKFVIFRFYEKQNNLIISLKNTITSSVLKENPKLITKKYDSKNHGIGIRSMKKIINKYNGILDFYEKKNYFCMSAIIPNKKSSRTD